MMRPPSLYDFIPKALRLTWIDRNLLTLSTPGSHPSQARQDLHPGLLLLLLRAWLDFLAGQQSGQGARSSSSTPPPASNRIRRSLAKGRPGPTAPPPLFEMWVAWFIARVLAASRTGLSVAEEGRGEKKTAAFIAVGR